MARVVDIAKYILEKQGRITPMKLQKLVYYAQVWWSVEHDEPLFAEPIKAWAQGPVVPPLFQEHKGRAMIDVGVIEGDITALSEPERDGIDRVLAFYGQLPPQYLSDLTHYERPWKDARAAGDVKGYKSPTISVLAIRTFYRGRTPEDLDADYQMSVASEIMDQHRECLERLAL